jgi:hypothetical protein
LVWFSIRIRIAFERRVSHQIQRIRIRIASALRVRFDIRCDKRPCGVAVVVASIRIPVAVIVQSIGARLIRARRYVKGEAIGTAMKRPPGESFGCAGTIIQRIPIACFGRLLDAVPARETSTRIKTHTRGKTRKRAGSKALGLAGLTTQRETIAGLFWVYFVVSAERTGAAVGCAGIAALGERTEIIPTFFLLVDRDRAVGKTVA